MWADWVWPGCCPGWVQPWAGCWLCEIGEYEGKVGCQSCDIVLGWNLGGSDPDELLPPRALPLQSDPDPAPDPVDIVAFLSALGLGGVLTLDEGHAEPIAEADADAAAVACPAAVVDPRPGLGDFGGFWCGLCDLDCWPSRPIACSGDSCTPPILVSIMPG